MSKHLYKYLHRGLLVKATIEVETPTFLFLAPERCVNGRFKIDKRRAGQMDGWSRSKREAAAKRLQDIAGSIAIYERCIANDREELMRLGKERLRFERLSGAIVVQG